MTELSAQHLKKSFKSRTVVNDVSINIRSGECVGLLGPNGAGKTTCFYMIVGLQACDEGQIILDGQDVTRAPMHQRARLGIGYLPQEASVFRKMTVADNILSILQLRTDLSKMEQQKKLLQLMEEFHIEHLRKSLGMSLSGGERRRVEIARALAIEPTFILLDEPFAGVDPISVLDIKRIISHLCDKNIGILITDHNVRETLDICERAYIVSQGKILCEGSPDSILANQQVRAVYLGEEFSL
ncbi:lipopolysaccharide transport protein B: ATP-binding component of ABC superfamily protein [Legionella quinlivanii]|uniref:Lipopolysaccharide export system ATP-binding protein LptB n=1 Tax=Legionella quinlivanii TaxID=45073 RepID=A0A0W0XLF7_9GAMM|nr:LPS export ABC transporter ATP-binding protein [Legionella quinlivanii]KTD45298.1 lipopolysaccharide transport protein B: ATP-binding component of ABC superfamily protein [Legionella quinlivanii]MCW8450420.1 LPS export ABC transporter ATP-binding protein [Legionella quinlivanii]SEG02444.1 lipopolysaccharide export system ATP-binding protein [Legionella quinlivanii DSM 21216]STY11402.1 lipopolysaccharide transport protein B: ATP-binding component of ABC superfamily [Legionella quinlivanii]